MNDTPPSSALKVQNLTVNYQAQPVLWHVNFSLPQGQLTGIIGPNGAGKSTLLKACMGLIPIEEGKIYFHEAPLGKMRKQVNYVPQHSGIDWDFPINVRQVAMMGRCPHLGFFKRPTTADEQIVDDVLAQVGIAALAERPIGALSGGQRQRVLLARALAQQATIYLMDEPFNGVDTATEAVMLQVFKTMAQQGKSVVVVHHALHAVHLHFDWCVLLNKKLIAAGPMATTFTPTLLQQAYGGSNTILHQVTALLKRKGDALRNAH